MLLLLVLVSLLFNTQVATAHEINITRRNKLETVLCHSGPFNNDTVIVLFTNITHEITNISFCLINTSHSLTIKSATNSLAHIKCPTAVVSQPSYPTSGFVFVNLYNLTLQKLSFQGCGAFLRDLDGSILSSINSTTSPVYFTEYHSSLLLFLHIETLLIKEVNMLSNYGFSVLAINPSNAIIENINVTSTKSFEFYQQTNMSLGNGVLLLFTDENDVKSLKKNVLINKASFEDTFDYIDSVRCLSDLSNLLHQQNFNSIPVVNAVCLTILYTQHNFSANVQISSTNITHHYGSYSGAMLVLHIKSVTNSQTVINNGSIFLKNYNLYNCHGAALSLLMTFYQSYDTHLHPLIVSNSVFLSHQSNDDFYDHTTRLNTRAVSVFIHYPQPTKDSDVTVTFRNVNFSENHIKTTGSCLYATSYSYSYENYSPLIVVLEDVIAYQNTSTGFSTSISKAGLFTIVGIRALHINGSNSYYFNNSGSVFEVIDSNIILDGNMLFEGNRGERGAVFKLYGSSTFHLKNGLRATFINNIAHTKGGAIYAQYEDYIYKTIKQCTFQVLSPFPNISEYNISMVFINNKAGLSGSSIFSTNLYNCYMNESYITPQNAKSYYNKIFKFGSFVITPLNLSTLSSRHCLCFDNKCLPVPNVSLVYPGQTLHISMAARDVMNNPAYTTISLTLAESKSLSPLPSWYISPHDENQVLLESYQCTLVNFTVYKRDIDPKTIDDTILVVSSADNSMLLNLDIKLLDYCPLGFELNTTTGTCQCSSAIKKLGLVGDYKPICQIISYSLATIIKPPESTAWGGLMKITNGTNMTTVFGVAHTCHESCNNIQDYTMFLINGSDVLIADPNNYLVNNLPLCTPTKTGPLCSTCTTVNGIKYSVVFGSSECKQCSNWWLLTLILYAVAGPLLIYLLFVLKLTLTTGTLNGIIFYAQAIGVLNKKITSSHHVFSSLYSLTHVFLSILNLNLGFPLCFYNGMTELWKAGLSLLFPLYLLTIVVVLIILSRYSLRLSNRIAHSSVQVLVTVVHLSFISMFTSISNIVGPINIYTNDTSNPIFKVWYRDGTVEYGKGSHLILMIFILLVVGPVMFSYMTILVAGRPLMRIDILREYIRPVYEAIHGPYKHNKEFFFTTRLLLLVFLYTLDILYKAGDIYKSDVIAIPIIAFYVTIEVSCRPFRKMWLNIFDLFIMWNCVIVFGISWHFFSSFSQMSNILALSTIIVFLALIIVIIFHFLWVTGKLDQLKQKLNVLRVKFIYKFHLYFDRIHHSSRPSQLNTCDLQGSFFETCDESREPLLSPT